MSRDIAYANGQHYGQAYRKVFDVGALIYIVSGKEALQIAIKHCGSASAYHADFEAGFTAELERTTL